MTQYTEAEHSLDWQEEALEEMANYHRPSEPLFERQEWQHTPDAEIVPWWVIPLMVLIALALFIVLVHAGTFNPFINQ